MHYKKRTLELWNSEALATKFQNSRVLKFYSSIVPEF